MADKVRVAEIEAVMTARDEMTSKLQRATEQAGGLGSGLRGAAGAALGFGGAMVGLAVGGAAFGMIGDSIIGMNARLETATLQFTTLMGNSDQAKKHVQDLFAFAAKTPFATQPLIDASRIMRVFGGSALDTMANLRLFGDAAAATSADVGSVTEMSARMYAALQAGQPIGRAALELEHMGVLMPQVAVEMEKMQKKGASGAEVWAYYESYLNRFNGAMGRQMNTFEGLKTTLIDNLQLAIAKGFSPFFDKLKDGMAVLVQLFGSAGFQSALTTFGNVTYAVFTKLFDVIGKVFGAIGPVVIPVIRDLVKGIGAFIGEVRDGVSPVKALFDTMAGPTTAITALGGVMLLLSATVATLAMNLRDHLHIILGEGARLWREVLHPALVQVSAKLTELAPKFETLVTKIQPLINIVLSLAEDAFAIAVRVLSVILPVAIGVAATVIGGLIDTLGHLADFVTAVFTLISDIIHGKWGQIWKDVGDILGAAWQTVTTILKTIIDGIISFFTGLWNKLTGHSIIPDMIKDIVSWFAGMPGRILGAIGNLAGTLVNAGKNLVGGFMSGITNAWSGLTKTVSNLASGIGHTISHILHIFSPSRVTYAHGMAVGQGLAQGIQSQHSPVHKAAKTLATSAHHAITTHLKTQAVAAAARKPTTVAALAGDINALTTAIVAQGSIGTPIGMLDQANATIAQGGTVDIATKSFLVLVDIRDVLTQMLNAGATIDRQRFLMAFYAWMSAADRMRQRGIKPMSLPAGVTG